VGGSPVQIFDPLKTLKLVMGQGLRLARVGVGFEVLGALVLTRFMSGLP
jgi:hypothetical protein